MKLLFDLFPVILFFVTYTLFPRFGPKEEAIFYATAVTIAATFAQIGWVWLKHRKVDTMLWVSLCVIVVFGGATLLLHDETFIKWKPTVLYWLFAAILAVARLGFGKNLIQTLMKEQIELPEPGWARMLWSWVGFFAFMGVTNLYVAFNYSTDAWVNFKMFGTLGLMLVFVLGQGFMLSRYMEHEKEEGK